MFIDFFQKKLPINRIKYKVSDSDKGTVFEKTDTTVWLFANYAIVFLILLSILLVWLDTIPDFSSKHWFGIFLIDLFISGVFLIEYLYRWKYSSHKWQFPFRLMNILDLLSFLPFFILILIYGIWSYSIFAIFRIFRVFRIFELIERVPIVTKLIRWINKHKLEYFAAIFVMFIVLVSFSTIAYLWEQRWWNTEMFRSIPDTFWWALITMSNTWYGDMIPVSLLWKTVWWILMILWPIMIAILSSITVIIFLNSTKLINLKSRSDNSCKKCWLYNDIDAVYCKSCWSKI